MKGIKFKCEKCGVPFDCQKERDIHKMNCKRKKTDDKARGSNDSNSKSGQRRRPTIKSLDPPSSGDDDSSPSSSKWKEQESRNKTPMNCAYCGKKFHNFVERNSHHRSCKDYKANEERERLETSDSDEDDDALSDPENVFDNKKNDLSDDDPSFDPSAKPSTSSKWKRSSNSLKGKDADKPFKCQKCVKSYKGFAWLQNHMAKAHKINITSAGSGNNEMHFEDFICKDCKYKFKTFRELSLHRVKARTKRTIKCPKHCCESFSSDNYLSRHLDLNHRSGNCSESNEANKDANNMATPPAEANGNSPSGGVTQGLTDSSSELAGSSSSHGKGALKVKAKKTSEEQDTTETEDNNSRQMMDIEDPLKPDKGFTLFDRVRSKRSSSSKEIIEDIETNEADNTANNPSQTGAATIEVSSPAQEQNPSLPSASFLVGKRTLEGGEQEKNLGVKKSRTVGNNDESNDSDNGIEKALSIDDLNTRRNSVTVSDVPVPSLDALIRPSSDVICKVEGDEIRHEEAILPDILVVKHMTKNSKVSSQKKTKQEENNPGEEEIRQMPILSHAAGSGSDVTSMERSAFQEDAVSTRNRNFSLKFLLKIWNVNNDANEAHYLHVKELLQEILFGIRVYSAPTDIIALLKKEPEKTVGYLLMQIVLIDFMRNVDIIEVLKLYNEAVETFGSDNSNIYQRLIKTVTLFKLGKAVDASLETRKEIRKTIHVTLSNHKVRKIITNIIKIITSSSKPVDPIELPLGLFEDTSIQSEDMASNVLFDKKEWSIRCYFWLSLYDKLKFSFTSSSQQSLLELVLEHSQQCQVGTIVFANIFYGASMKPLNLHEEILQPLLSSEGRPNEGRPLIKATEEDKSTFIKLLYDGTKSNLAKEVTIPVFKIAEALHIKDIWNFLFPKELNYKAYAEENKKAIFEIALSVENELAMREIGKYFNTWVRPTMQHACLLNCTSKQVIWFLGRNYANLEEFDKYMIIMRWAHFQCKKPCPEPEDIKFDEEVAIYFKQVSSTLDIGKLRNGGRDSITIQQGYIISENENDSRDESGIAGPAMPE